MKKALLTLLALLAITCARAQQNEIITTEFDPPLLIQGDDEGGGNHQAKIQIDLDEDGEIDFEICFGFGKSGYYLYQVGYSNTKFREVGLWESDTIIPYDGPWTDVPYFSRWTDRSTISSDDVTGDYYDKVGFYKVVDGQKYYGWIHRYGHEDFRFPFKKWIAVDKVVFCTIPNYPLQWGQTTLTGIEENNESNSFATLHPNPTNGQVTITGENLRKAEVVNMLGQQVLSVKKHGNELQINMEALPAGIYFVAITNEEGRKCVRKVVKE